MKRYAIVNCEGRCPSWNGEEISGFLICPKGDDKDCKRDCPYGDTKEQLVRKVAQAIKRELKGDCVAGLKDTVFVMKWCVAERLAKEIVEFLGVEE